MHIILDASAIIAEDFGRSVRFRTLLAASKALDYEVIVPSLAIAETVGKFHREIGKEDNSVRRVLGQLSKLLGRRIDPTVVGIDPGSESESFKSALESRLQYSEVIILSYPDVAHEDIAERAISRRRPFDQNGSGYRDTLIWLSALKLAGETGGQIILVSEDGDFGTANGLHGDLTNDLVEAGHPKDKVMLSKSLSNVIDEYVLPKLSAVLLEKPLAALADLGVDAQEATLLAIQTAYNHVEWEPNELGLPPECETPTLYYVEGGEDLQVVEVRALPDGRLLARIVTKVFGGFNFFMLKADLYVVDEDPRLDVADFDWNEYGLLGEITLELNATIDLLIDQSNPLKPQAQVVSLAIPEV